MGVSCGRETPTGSLDIRVPPPRVLITLGFGDPPVTGHVALEPTIVEGAAPWRYAVDLDGDGTPDAEGEAMDPVSVPYRFEEVGPHLVTITIERGDDRIVSQEHVVVNNPDAIEVLGSGGIGAFDDQSIGIAVDRAGDFVFATTRREGTISRLDALSLDLVAESFVGGPGVLEGLSAAPDEDLLYSLTAFVRLVVLSIPELVILNSFENTEIEARFYVQALPGRQAYVSGGTGRFTLLDTETGAALKRNETPGAIAGNFAVSPDGSRIVVVLGSGARPDGLAVLRASDLGTIWEADLRQTAPVTIPSGVSKTDALAFSRDGDRIYVMRLLLEAEFWELLVLSTDDGSLVRRVSLGRGCVSAIGCEGSTNPTAVSADGSFVAFATGQGAVFVDRSLDLPLYRTPPADYQVYCCGVASNPVRDEFYFNSFLLDRVTKVRIRR